MLEYLNLEGNIIEELLPSDNIKNLKNLRVLRLAHNRIHDIGHILHLSSLPILENITLNFNPISEMEHLTRYVTHNIRTIRLINGVEVTDTDRMIADQQFDRSLINTAISNAKEAVILANEYKEALYMVIKFIQSL